MKSKNKELSDEIFVEPFLKWVGGKRWLLHKYSDLFPSKFNRYIEPFLGSGAVFFHIYGNAIKKRYILSDLNTDLINTYKQVRDNCDSVIKYLKEFKNTKFDYYKVRSTLRNGKIFNAARFIYLNKTCFNGIYRVNQRGIFNVPYGRNENRKYFDENNLRKVNAVLRTANIQVRDFEKTISLAQRGDFIFLDPPYTVAHKNNGFLEYNEKIFSWEDQQRLALCIKTLKRNKVEFVLTNAAHESIDSLYRGFANKIEVERASTISGVTKNRSRISEYIYTNCV